MPMLIFHLFFHAILTVILAAIALGIAFIIAVAVYGASFCYSHSGSFVTDAIGLVETGERCSFLKV
jgi:prepilin signal peptidase PulO-like enzyme (type II secretory pathway)